MTKKILTTLLLFFIITSKSQPNSATAIINKAGKQRMLSQCMAKNMLYIGADINTDKAKLELEKSISEFIENQHEIIIYVKDDETKSAVNAVNDIWQKFRLKTTEKVQLENANNIIKDSYTLMNACNLVVELLEAKSGIKIAKLANSCGKQRMLSQRMAMLYVCNYWGVNYANLNKDIKETLDTFELLFSEIIIAPQNSQQIVEILNRQHTEWDFLKKSIASEAKNLKPISIYSTTNLITFEFDKVMEMYVKL